MKLLLVEDDPHASASIAKGLREEGFIVEVAADGEEGLLMARGARWDCLVLDVMLPGVDGFTMLGELRASGSEVPVIFLTARDTLSDRLRGLAAGGGDYLVKPFAFSELVLRIRNLLSRGMPVKESTWSVGDLTVDPVRMKVYRAGQRLDLSAQEFRLLELLVRHEGHVLTRARIAEELWDLAFESSANLVDAAVRRVRRKVDDPFGVKLIHTRRGVGYLIAELHD
ncbi:response regulator [Mesoterricola silvestris]|uniref:DNA-binding response regulator n=1 Tax=Mesoterricola silvestris TaxID=2927979 RepID=A0AA48GQ14_9BACT|nr:response regulator [Mesoterricola silvestris]BDU71897.1 DNA-binding response regulator [Mesoterricola silvestris]